MPVLVLTGSVRRGSTTRRLGEALAALAPGAVLADPLTTLPFFDQDLESEPPAAVQRLREQVASADALAFVTPEYNGAVPGLLGNAVDWLSRPHGALRGTPVLALAASPGGGGGARALRSLTTLLTSTGAVVLGELSVPQVDRRLQDGADPALEAELRLLVGAVQASSAA